MSYTVKGELEKIKAVRMTDMEQGESFVVEVGSHDDCMQVPF